MASVKTLDNPGLTAQEIEEKRKVKESRVLGVKAFQAKTTYELGFAESPNRKLMRDGNWRERNNSALKDAHGETIVEVAKRDTIANMGNH